MNDFLDEIAEKYSIDRDNVIAVGYSNGANIAASLLFHYQNALKGAILHHPMVPRRGIDLPDLTGTSVFIAAGTNDPICSPQESEELKSLLEKASADVELHWEKRGHQLTREEVEAAANWYHKSFK
ncbi:carboxylesterase [Mesobacillus boroniphilus JCM 21738]|uniref:Carboxylesterase n=1 Tax=Mesobacillus boroniphilus JCM 21738 TaxID=1294265 RepID=W4RUI4_9BACI|nr:carboxylesterase [Mesobacillus boroniphilus JCM 21738]